MWGVAVDGWRGLFARTIDRNECGRDQDIVDIIAPRDDEYTLWPSSLRVMSAAKRMSR